MARETASAPQMNGAAWHRYVALVRGLPRKAWSAVLGPLRRRVEPPSFDPSQLLESPSTSGIRQPTGAAAPLAPVFEPPEDESDPTRVFESVIEAQPAAVDSTDAVTAGTSIRRRLHDMMLAGAIAGLLAGIAEAIQLERAGLGLSGGGGAVRFVAIAGLLAAPIGAIAGAALCLAWSLAPVARLAAIRGRLTAPWVYAVALVLPGLVGALFRFSFWVRSNVQDESLAALASALVSPLLFGGALGVGFLLATAARVAGRRYPAVLRLRAACLTSAALWVLIALPSLVAGPDGALHGPFGFIGLFRKDTLDYKPVVTGLVFLLGFAALVPVKRLHGPTKPVLSAALALWAAIAFVRAGDDAIRPVVLENGMLTRLALRSAQRLGDWDGDGFSRWLGGGDCNDSDPRIHPGAREIPGNGIDEDCDGEDLHPPSPSARALVAVPRVPREKIPQNLSFLFITVDTLRPDLGYMGYPRDVSPQIDKLAEKSVVYERAYSISTYTGYCLPPLMASRYPSEMPRTFRHEVRYFGQNVLLAERLKQAGFHTAGAASHFLFAPELGWVDGFDRFLKTPAEGNAPIGSHIDRFYTSRGLADATIGLLKDPEVTQGRFFIWVHFLDPHHQYLKHPGFSKFGSAPRDLYDGEIAFTDHHIGRLLDALDASGLADRTVVVLTGDHGEAFGEHGAYYHGREIWDEIVRVPLIIRVPGAAPRRVARRVSHVDLAPTVLDLAGVEADPGARGESLAPEIFGVDLPERPILIDQPRNPYYEPKRGFIEGGLKLHHLIESNTYRLYDLDHDPHETHDLAPDDQATLRRVRHDYAELTSQIIEVAPTPVGDK